MSVAIPNTDNTQLASMNSQQRGIDTSYDLVLATSDAEFHVHSTILIIHSPVFRAMLTDDCVERRERRVQITDLTSAQIETFLQRVYAQRLTDFTLPEIALLFPVAHKYMVASLVQQSLAVLANYRCKDEDGPAIIECVRVVGRCLHAELMQPRWSASILDAIANYLITLRLQDRFGNMLSFVCQYQFDMNTTMQLLATFVDREVVMPPTKKCRRYSGLDYGY